MQQISISAPDYTVDSEPDYKAIGKLIDIELKKHFLGKEDLTSWHWLARTPQ